jgi:hypothetical protein
LIISLQRPFYPQVVELTTMSSIRIITFGLTQKFFLHGPSLWLVILITFALGWVFYQRFLSPLAGVPGPFWASISRLWYLQRMNAGDMHHYTKKLHKKYGLFQTYI